MNDTRSTKNPARRVVAFAFLTVFLDLLGFGIILPLMPFYVNGMGGTAETLGILLGCFSFTQLVATPLLGRISDRFGRRKVILVSLAGNALSMIVFALATKWLSLPLLFASRIFAGATAGNIAACQASATDVTTAEERASALGRIAAAVNLGVILGPLTGSALSGFGAWAPPLGAAALALVDLVAAFFLMPETLHLRLPPSLAPRSRNDTPFRALLRWPIASVLAMYFLAFLCLTNLQVALALLAQLRFDWGPRNVGLLFTMFGATSFVMQTFFIGRLTRILGEGFVVVGGALASAGAMLLIGEVHQPAGLMAGVALFGVGFGTSTTVLASLASKSVRGDIRGFALGILQSSGGLARTFGPLFGGILFRRVAPEAPFLVGVGASLLGGAIALARRATVPPKRR
jgi:DHA1 family tetracycline resistance protein-like MFS transporter